MWKEYGLQVPTLQCDNRVKGNGVERRRFFWWREEVIPYQFMEILRLTSFAHNDKRGLL